MSLHSAPVAVSPQLAAAQEQLSQRRQQRRQERLAANLPIRTDEQGRPQHSQPRPTGQPLSPGALAPHLGWESEGFMHAQRAATALQERRAAYQAARQQRWSPPRPESCAPARSADRDSQRRKQASPVVRLFPDIAVAMLRQGAVAPGRLWLLLQHIDEPGQGWISTAEARSRLCTPGAALYLCGWRQLRNLLDQGEGLFWQRDGDAGRQRIWLAGTARVALRLGVARIHLVPVALPVAHLLQGIGTVRAHFYASYHSSRYHSSRYPSSHDQSSPAGNARPISRATLAELTQVRPRSQRAYEMVAGVHCQPNWAIGPSQAEASTQELSWAHGQALFTFVDRRGHYGQPGARYLAWQLPNSYQGPHQTRGRCHQKALNQQLVDLYSKGFTGNGKRQEEGASEAPLSRFYDNGQAAVRALNRGLRHDAYWRTPRLEKQFHIWHVLPASEGGS